MLYIPNLGIFSTVLTENGIRRTTMFLTMAI